jgi:type 1 fimbria pilin
MRRFIMLVTMALLLATMLVASTGVAQALPSGTVSIVRTDSGVAVDPAACEWAAGTAGLEWRAGGVCWLELPGWSFAS